MTPDRRRRRNVVLAAAVLVPLVIVLVFGLSLANTAGVLPWQADPTRIPITPFADLPGVDAPGAGLSPVTAAATPTS